MDINHEIILRLGNIKHTFHAVKEEGGLRISQFNYNLYIELILTMLCEGRGAVAGRTR